ncbi:hypothetical protein D1646_09120 [Pseudoflavonifractor sp. 60]|uniref:hypothetical protein n=1 Tax=Pseudoflavonifractor sp. 60 TaxID=2304576 RepID=UPI00136E097F|nr:hypothetical protein [Pseudoflavonifractor sp. 60]NBI66974.1 hypothetical protein [Pseudoflavonifractor sp. 60]
MNNYQRAHSPFEDSATQRLRRMGLTTEDGSLERDAMAVFSSIFAGQFFDDLCDYYQDYENVQETIAQIFHTAEQADPRQKFLLICLQYDSIYRSLPDPVWWISGSPAFAELFAEDFLTYLKRLAENT